MPEDFVEFFDKRRFFFQAYKVPSLLALSKLEFGSVRRDRVILGKKRVEARFGH